MIRPSVIEDVEYLSQNLRPEDVEECLASGVTPLDALRHGFACSTPCLTGVTPDPAAMFGVAPGGLVWLLGTPAIEKHSVAFLRRSHAALEVLHADNDLLWNYTFAKNTLHHRWLKWLGFKFLRKVELQGNQFYEFARLKGTI